MRRDTVHKPIIIIIFFILSLSLSLSLSPFESLDTSTFLSNSSPAFSLSLSNLKRCSSSLPRRDGVPDPQGFEGSDLGRDGAGERVVREEFGGVEETGRDVL